MYAFRENDNLFYFQLCFSQYTVNLKTNLLQLTEGFINVGQLLAEKIAVILV